MVYSFALHDYVSYNSTYGVILELTWTSDNPTYDLKTDDGNLVENVKEDEMVKKTNTEIINIKWVDFTYNGNNGDASIWIIENILKNVKSLSDIKCSSNEDNSIYTLKVGSETWSKNK